jgi:hypothetical protein
MKKLFLLFLSFFFITSNSYAEYTTLFCDHTNGYSNTTVSFDEEIQKIKMYNGKETQGSIDENEISWKQIGKGRMYFFHKIIRSSGRYYVSNQNNQVLASYVCEIKKQKF